MKKKLHSWIIGFATMGIIIVLGFVKVIIPSYPYGEALYAIVAVAGLMIVKRAANRHKSFRDYGEENESP